MLFDGQVLGQRFAACRGWARLLLFRLRWQLGRLRARLEGRLRFAFDGRRWLGRPWEGRFALPALRDGQQFGHALIELGDDFRQLGVARKQLRQLLALRRQLLALGSVLLLKRGDVEHRAC